MSEAPNEPSDLGTLIASAAEAEDAVVAESIIRTADFIVFQQIDMESGEVEHDGEGNFSVVLADVDEDIAVVCFTNAEAAANFQAEISEDLPEGHELPSVMLAGETLLDGLPPDCGLLIDPGAETECYFSPGCFQAYDEDDVE